MRGVFAPIEASDADMVLALLASALTLASALASERCPVGEDVPASRRLRNDLFCSYDRHLRPRSGQGDAINVTANLDLKFVEVSHFENQVTVHVWLILRWRDDFLTWTPSDYDGIEKLVVGSDTIWVPDVTVFNADSTHLVSSQHTNCVLEDTGKVVCAPPLKTQLLCRLQLAAWPHDLQNCSMEVGSWTSGQKIHLVPSSKVDLESFTPNLQWQLLNVTVQQDQSEGEPVQYNFVIKRHAAMHVARVVVPAFVVSGLTLASFLVRREVRVALCCVSCLAGVLMLTFVGFVVPAHGDSSPTIVLFYRDALALSLSALVFGVLATAAREGGDHAPLWVARVFGGAGGGVAPPRVRDSARGPPWGVFAGLLDRLAFLVLLATHAVMLAALLP